MKIKMILSYEGTNYVGWQMQPNGISIQESLQKALSTLLKEEVKVIGSGRTDAGVHALGQVAHFTAERMPSIRSVNGLLPHDIRVKELCEVDSSFHARYSAKRKEYHYNLWLEEVIDPFYRLYRHHIRWDLDIALLQEVLRHFVGTHDFCTFANVNSSVRSSVRTLYRVDLVPQKGGYRIEFEGDGFLYKMIRNIVGTSLEIARGKRSLEALESLFAARDRRKIGVAAPARGLFLVKVDYSSEKLLI